MSYKAGSVIGDYVVIGTVGAGGMGTVYKVQHVITERIEAMKLLLAIRAEPEQEQRFVREIQVQARLHHPNIAAVYNAFRYYDEFFLVMEFVEGESLDTMLRRGRLPMATGIHYARQALFALGYAHAHGVVHRDIAPSNMIITPDGTVKLTDFGLAKTTTDIRLTHSGAPVGSPWYMSPEQVRGDAALDARSDIYSLGVILYEIATGRKPFDLPSTFDVMRAHVEMVPAPPIESAPDLPRALNDIILTAMAKDPNTRFQSAEQFYTALESLQNNPATTAVPVASQPGRAPSANPRVRPAKRNRISIGSLGLDRVRLAQTGLGTAACGLALFGGYATYSFVRVKAAPRVQEIAPVKFPVPAPQTARPLSPEPVPESPVEPASLLPEPIASKPKPTRVVQRLTPPQQVAIRRPESSPAVATLAALPSPVTPPPVPAIPRPPVTAAAPLAAAPPDASAIQEVAPLRDLAPQEVQAPPKKNGNRLFRALHRVFRKPGSSGQAESPAPDGASEPSSGSGPAEEAGHH